jgi:hypothetical protein
VEEETRHPQLIGDCEEKRVSHARKREAFRENRGASLDLRGMTYDQCRCKGRPGTPTGQA